MCLHQVDFLVCLMFSVQLQLSPSPQLLSLVSPLVCYKMLLNAFPETILELMDALRNYLCSGTMPPSAISRNTNNVLIYSKILPVSAIFAFS